MPHLDVAVRLASKIDKDGVRGLLDAFHQKFDYRRLSLYFVVPHSVSSVLEI
jgi:hypothetical protein